MPKIKVVYIKEVTEVLDWPEDEMRDFDYDNLELNLDTFGEVVSEHIKLGSISSVKINGIEHEF